MANFTAADVKTLRDRLGAGMLDSKNALVEADGDIEKAIEILRVKGLKGVAKREGRATTAGLVAATETTGAATIIELASETDFVAKNDRFIALASEVLGAVAEAGADTVEAGNAATVNGQTVSDYINDNAALMGEKVELRTVARVDGTNFAIYLHKTSQDLPPQVGVVVAYSGDDAETARSIAQHIAFADPKYLTREDVPTEAVEKERGIVEETTRAEGKPEAALPKIIEGRLNGFFKEIVLLEQGYAKDSKVSVAKVAQDAGLTIEGFARVKVGA
ncbi:MULTISPECIES: translation elongation factor Ts [unclassified Curtobacterium]|uniref:translation elongation factor Ts n=1 Tax=unclassified Curtobacterium TaxID=257496 RepID=UPI000DA8A488|nr:MULTISPECIES: translation elongation factor Ts [unclassified Curtobacterium]PZE28944.1 elongation factor Ts [Curtobacterium sp. MCBD17_028]PZE73727.1 elongation factor Ts [Curtobacterium sp. MCBD17_019]PZF57547.1 elongation factor Ts [Curtobacterium sp. MCBD17_034]PZF65327.1 elongation factor Ts [Curtobacterium sp. MCBD17_013]PZM33639.1 elongation factor Ts [Curtobacterium sp. MCBD17_031]